MTSQSYEQLKALLWAEEGARVHAVIDGSRVEGLAAKLASADVLGWDGLWRGALPEARAAVAPYVVELTWESAFTDWLLGKAGLELGAWGVLAVGSVSLLDVRELGRRLLQVETPDGDTHELVWYDPDLWTELLPRLSGSQCADAFGALSSWVTIRKDVWTWLVLSAGEVVVDARRCLPEAGA